MHRFDVCMALEFCLSPRVLSLPSAYPGLTYQPLRGRIVAPRLFLRMHVFTSLWFNGNLGEVPAINPQARDIGDVRSLGVSSSPSH